VCRETDQCAGKQIAAVLAAASCHRACSRNAEQLLVMQRNYLHSGRHLFSPAVTAGEVGLFGDESRQRALCRGPMTGTMGAAWDHATRVEL